MTPKAAARTKTQWLHDDLVKCVMVLCIIIAREKKTNLVAFGPSEFSISPILFCQLCIETKSNETIRKALGWFPSGRRSVCRILRQDRLINRIERKKGTAFFSPERVVKLCDVPFLSPHVGTCEIVADWSDFVASSQNPYRSLSDEGWLSISPPKCARQRKGKRFAKW